LARCLATYISVTWRLGTIRAVWFRVSMMLCPSRRARDNAAAHPVGLWVFDRACRRGLLHARDRGSRDGSTGRWRSRRLAGDGRDRRVAVSRFHGILIPPHLGGYPTARL